MERNEKRALWQRLVDEARESKTCVVCLEPLRHVTNRAPVKCRRAECRRGYHALYRRLGRQS